MHPIVCHFFARVCEAADSPLCNLRKRLRFFCKIAHSNKNNSKYFKITSLRINNLLETLISLQNNPR